MRKVLVLVCGLLILGLLNYTIYSREALVSSGQSIYLELAPVDPRSLMQGDYMALRFAVTGQARQTIKAATEKDGFVVLKRDERGVGQFIRLDNGEALASDELRMLYRQRNNSINFATNAFFFQEGKALLYEDAKFGEFKVAENGDSILVAMRDKDFQQLGEITKPLLD
ncbi:GDYXXLXY domain-containing protein [Leucothrix arctica]|uniref:GDYXXLXY domain-containing protein n=1 Tax=Leucothrix arctica TaxID=1481894 RepID=A0A317CJ12_9GAMM|nr:GDYXXLXY domain-containing protein [Leucothrix arctica]PWQ98319.1 hypothetical protein DKT75_04085 [Leucothrix arctica]